MTALSLMQEVNTGDEQIIDDNYRTWYEVFVYSFFDSDGDGIGDLNGLTEKLDYINDGDPATDTDLGCNGIWLMPVMPSTTYHKYDVTDYCDIDPEYGTMDDFKNLIAACHERGINVIIDLVMNHTSSQHEWFKTAADYLKTCRREQSRMRRSVLMWITIIFLRKCRAVTVSSMVQTGIMRRSSGARCRI